MFTTKTYDVRTHIKLHNYFAGRFNRTRFLKEFCVKTGIDYKPIKKKKYQLPENYLIEHTELEYLSGIRDKVILAFYRDYLTAQRNIQKEMRAIEAEIRTQESIIKADEATLIRKKDDLTKARKDNIPINIIHYESLVEKMKTKILNEESRKAEKQAELEAKAKEFLTSKENWLHQIDIIENIFTVRKMRFEKNITKSVSNILGFSDFSSVLADYDEKVKRILKGEINEDI